MKRQWNTFKIAIACFLFAAVAFFCSPQSVLATNEAVNPPDLVFRFTKSSICMAETAHLTMTNPFQLNGEDWEVEYYDPYKNQNIKAVCTNGTDTYTVSIKPAKEGKASFRLLGFDGVSVAQVTAVLNVVAAVDGGEIEAVPSKADPYTIEYKASLNKHCSATIKTVYKWTFSDGQKAEGNPVTHVYTYGVNDFNASVDVALEYNSKESTVTLKKSLALPDSSKAYSFSLGAGEYCSAEDIIVEMANFTVNGEDSWDAAYSVDGATKQQVKASGRNASANLGKLSPGEHTIQFYYGDGSLAEAITTDILPAYSESPDLLVEAVEGGYELTADFGLHKRGGKACLSVASYFIDFGDGSTETNDSGTFTHAYAGEGPFSVEASADADGNVLTVYALLSIPADGSAPQVTLGPPAQAVRDLPLYLPQAPQTSAQPAPNTASGTSALANLAMLAASFLLILATLPARIKGGRGLDFFLVEVLCFMLLFAMAYSTSEFSLKFVVSNSYTAIFAAGFGLQLAACLLGFLVKKAQA